jgi:hypothetical protein
MTFTGLHGIGSDMLPRVYIMANADIEGPPEVAMSEIRSYLRRSEIPKPVGLTVLNIGFSNDFSVVAICVPASAALPLDFSIAEGVPIVTLYGAFEELELEGLGTPVIGDVEAMLAGGLMGTAGLGREEKLRTLRCPGRAPLEIGRTDFSWSLYWPVGRDGK